MNIHNIFSKGKAVSWIVKRQEYQKLDFTTNTDPIVLLYQSLSWWFPTSVSQNRKVYDGLCDIAWGMQFHKGEIEIEVYAVTRERLLEGGSTNYKTYDFETSQNLFLTTYDRSPQVAILNGAQWFNGKLQYENIRHNDDPFNPDQDYYTREEIPQRTKKTIDIHFTNLHHNNIWKVIKSTDTLQVSKNNNQTTVVATLIPGPQENEPYGVATNATTANNSELLQNNSARLTKATMWNRATYPMKILHPPSVNDETGRMKWVYECRISTKLHTTFHLWPDFNDNFVDDMLIRQTWQLPSTTQVNNGTDAYCSINCNAYEVHV